MDSDSQEISDCPESCADAKMAWQLSKGENKGRRRSTLRWAPVRRQYQFGRMHTRPVWSETDKLPNVEYKSFRSAAAMSCLSLSAGRAVAQERG